MSYTDGDIWLDGPAVTEWFQQEMDRRGLLERRDFAQSNQLASMKRRMFEWAKSRYVRVDSVDRYLCFLRMHPVDLPEHLWVHEPGLSTSLDGRIKMTP